MIVTIHNVAAVPVKEPWRFRIVPPPLKPTPVRTIALFAALPVKHGSKMVAAALLRKASPTQLKHQCAQDEAVRKPVVPDRFVLATIIRKATRNQTVPIRLKNYAQWRSWIGGRVHALNGVNGQIS